MRWEDESYVRLYKRETPEWSVLSWQARALFYEILKRADRAGILEVGKSGTRGLAGLVRMPIDVVEQALRGPDGLLADGCVVEREGGGFILPNYIAAQQAAQSDKTRKQEQRDRARANRLATKPPNYGDVTFRDQTSRAVTDGHGDSEQIAQSPSRHPHDDSGGPPEDSGGPPEDPPSPPPVTFRDSTSRFVTERHEESHAVTRGHGASQTVTLSLAERSEAKQISRSFQKPPPPQICLETARARTEPAEAAAAPSDEIQDDDEAQAVLAILAAIRKHDSLAEAQTRKTAQRVLNRGRDRRPALKVLEIIQVIGEAGRSFEDNPPDSVVGRLMGFIDQGPLQEPEPQPAPRPPPRPPEPQAPPLTPEQRKALLEEWRARGFTWMLPAAERDQASSRDAAESHDDRSETEASCFGSASPAAEAEPEDALGTRDDRVPERVPGTSPDQLEPTPTPKPTIAKPCADQRTAIGKRILVALKESDNLGSVATLAMAEELATYAANGEDVLGTIELLDQRPKMTAGEITTAFRVVLRPKTATQGVA